MSTSTKEKNNCREKGLSAKLCLSIACKRMPALKARKDGAQQRELQSCTPTRCVVGLVAQQCKYCDGDQSNHETHSSTEVAALGTMSSISI
jgi:hypothetical protein